MSLKFKYKAKEEVPAEAQSLYVEREGAFVLDVEGAVDKARVEEVRASNVALSHQLAEQKRRFEAIESDQVKAIAAERDALNGRLMAIQLDQDELNGSVPFLLLSLPSPLSLDLHPCCYLYPLISYQILVFC
jgi:hypothetical protein